MFYAWVVDQEACITSFINGLHVASKFHQTKAPQQLAFGGTMVTVAGSTYRDFFREIYIPAAKYNAVKDW